MPTLQPTRDIFVQANGLRHHLIARGHPGSPVVLLIHGLAGQAHTFDGIANHLAANYHVYCLDVRGRGESEWGAPEDYNTDTYVADLEAVVEALGLQRFSLIGTSMGGIITVNYTAKNPDRVQRAVLNDVGPEIDPAGLQRILQYVGNAPEMLADLKSVVKYYKEHYAPMVEHLNDDQLAEFARHNVRKSDSGMYVWKMDGSIRTTPAKPPSMDQWEALKAMTCPVLVLRGGKSDVLSADIARRMLEALPDGKLVEVPGVGHAPVLTEPEAKAALEEFLAG
ncbi:MAG TPA: alpha/beta hydrolase [Tepidiformaceae bacterium]|nr:alpha/beta hydrolase [Tepidiformaceae bacterium]